MAINPDVLVKMLCYSCDGQFIVSRKILETRNPGTKLDDIEVRCPYCQSSETNWLVMTNQEVDDNLGCLGIYSSE